MQEGENESQLIQKKFQSFGSEIYTPTDNICFVSKFNSSHYIYFYSYFSHSLSLSLSLVIRLLFYDLQPTGVTTHIVYHLASLHITKHQILLLYYLDNLIPPQLNILHLT